jgi:hypothetical protein
MVTNIAKCYIGRKTDCFGWCARAPDHIWPENPTYEISRNNFDRRTVSTIWAYKISNVAHLIHPIVRVRRC